MPDFHVISLLPPDSNQFNFSKFDQLSMNQELDVIVSMAIGDDTEPLKSKHTAILCDSKTSSEHVYKAVTCLAEIFSDQSNNLADEANKFYDHCLVLVIDRVDKNSDFNLAGEKSFRNSFYSSYKLFIPVVYVQTENQAVKALKRHQKLSYVNPIAENNRSSTQRFREFLNKVN